MKESVVCATSRHAQGGQLRWLAFDVITWLVMLLVARWVRHDFTLSGFVEIQETAGVIALILGVTLVLGILAGLYTSFRRVWPGSHTEIVMLVIVHGMASIAGAIAAGSADLGRVLPSSVPLIAGAFVIATTVSARTVWRWAWARFSTNSEAERVLIYGAGVRAFSYLSSLPTSGEFRPVGVFADAPEQLGSVVHGLTAGEFNPSRLQRMVDRTSARTVLMVTDNQPSPEVVRDVKKACDEVGVRVLILPQARATDPAYAPKHHPQPRELRVSDLIGREPVQLDETLPRQVLEGKRVLVTGGGGSIGSELARQVHRFNPAELMLLDRDEGGLHAAELSIYGTALLDGKNTILADIRDAETLQHIFMERRPEVVFHAAALKHQPLLEKFPTEAVQTNVLGTQNVLDAAAACGAEVVVNVSTDKAANPESVLGESKRAAERLTAEMSLHHPGKWVSVRFGNVFGSRGSVIGTFLQQIEEGGPVTVTDPDVERYFMTIPEAAQLVLQAAAVGESGETLVLEMGEPVKIADIARQLIKLYDNTGTVEIVYTGLRPGEKISEELVDDSETAVVGDRHELISEVRVDPIPLSDNVFDACHSTDYARWWLGHYGRTMGVAAQS